MSHIWSREYRELLELAFDEFEGALIVDKESRIVLITPRYAEILGVEPAKVVGKSVTEIIPHSRMPVVVKTGVPEIAQIWEVKGEAAVINRIPIRKGGEVIGAVAFSVFRKMEEVKDFLKRLDRLDEELKYYECIQKVPRTFYKVRARKIALNTNITINYHLAL